MYGFAVGTQYDIPVPFGLITPFFVYKTLTGTYTSEVQTNYSDYTLTGDVEAMATQQIGLDIYFKELDTSLSTMVQSDENGDLVYFSYNFRL